MTSPFLLPQPSESPSCTSMPEPSTNNTFKRYNKPPQPPLFIPPGHVAFRLLCHASRVGGLIGKSGSIIRQLQLITNSKIRVEDPADSSDNRVISVVASPLVTKQIKLSPETSVIGDDGDVELVDVSAAQEGIVRVFERVVEVAAEGDATAAGIGGVISCRLLVSKTQGGVVIGKGGKVVEKIRRETGCRIKVLAMDMFCSASSIREEIVEIEGHGLAVKSALVAVTGRLQEFPLAEQTKTYWTRFLESESLPLQTIDLPLQRSPIQQSTPSNSTCHAWGGGPSFESEKVSDMSAHQEVVFKILCPNERVGSIIGKGGSIVKGLQNETGALICIGPILLDCDERVITITAMESLESEYSPAQKAIVVVFNRFMETGVVRGLDSDSKVSPVSARVLVPSHQVGCLLGKGGAIISEMRKMTGTGLRIIGGNQLPKCASENNEVLQITGEFANVQDALYRVTGRLRDNIFSMTMMTGNGNRNSLRIENGGCGRVRDHLPCGSHSSMGTSDNLNGHMSLTQSMDQLAISSNKDQFTSLAANSGRLASVKGGVEVGSGSRVALVTNTSVEIVIPDDVIGSIYGENGSNLTRLRQISGAKVMVHEPDARTTQRIVVISGTPHETQAAQSLLQAFILTGS